MKTLKIARFIFLIIIPVTTFSQTFYRYHQCSTCENNKSQIDSFFYDAYEMLRGEDQRYEWGLGDCGSDDSEPGGAPGGSDQIAMQYIDDFKIDANNYYLELIWAKSYSSIAQLNYIITIYSDSLTYSNVVARAKFLRAYYYFNLLKNFGDIPLYLDFNEKINFKKSRNSSEEVWNAIETDLTEASAELPLRTEIQANDLYFISMESAEALLVKTYVYQQKWEEAYTLGKDIISSGSFSLVGLNGERYKTKFSDTTSGYQYIFTIEGENSQESLFEIQCNYTKNEFIYGSNSLIVQYQLPRAYFEPCSNDTLATCTNGYYAWGFNCPSDEFASEFENGDPRYNYTIAELEDSILIWNYKKNILEYKKIDFSYSSPTLRYSKKYWIHPEYRNLNNLSSQLNIKIIRYAELILWMAEASFKLGKFDEALDYVNMVRQRARNSGFKGTPANLTNITLNDIYHERRVELGLEGHRLYDLRRTSRAADEMSDIGFVADKHELFPIPQTVINISEGGLAQNPGYDIIPLPGTLSIINQPDIVTIGADFETSDTIYISIKNVMQDINNPTDEVIYSGNDNWALSNSTLNYFIRNNDQIVLYKRRNLVRTTIPLHLKGTTGLNVGECIIIIQLLGDKPLNSINQIEDQHLEINPDPVEIDMDTIFEDEDDETIAYQIIINNLELVCNELPDTGNVFKFHFSRNIEGTADVRIIGTSNGSQAENKFRFIVGNPETSKKQEILIDNVRVQLYPNPAAQSVVISGILPEINVYDLTILDVNGKIVYRSKIDGTTEFTNNISLENLNSGIYFVNIKSKQISSVNKLLIKK